MNPPFEVRTNRATSVIVQRVPADSVDAFLIWQHAISDAAAQFPGYQATEIFPPAAGRDEWVVLIHFDDNAGLQSWLDSPARAMWVAKLPVPIRDFRIRTIPAGLGAWFAGLDGRVPRWKKMLTVLTGLYPTILVLALFLSPYTQRFGLPTSLLIGNACSVVFLEFVGMPVITRLLGPWLRASGRAASIAGLVLIVAALGALTFVVGRLT